MSQVDDSVVAAVLDDVRDLDKSEIVQYTKDTITQLVFDVGALTCLLGPAFAWSTLTDILEHMRQNPESYNRLAATARDAGEFMRGLNTSADI